MAWTYRQSTGELVNAAGGIVGVGYSGYGPGKNNPAQQDVPYIGPIPQGTYAIGNPVDTPDHGPYCLPLVPHPANAMFGRSGFLIHGDGIHDPGEASEGCVIQDRAVRTMVATSGDMLLNVIG